MSDKISGEPQVGSLLAGSAKCADCGTDVRGYEKFCLRCCGKQIPSGAPLKRCRKYGFKVTYAQRQMMKLEMEVCGAIPVDADESRHAVKMGHLYVACNGKTYAGYTWIFQCGSNLGWSESYPPNEKHEARGE